MYELFEHKADIGVKGTGESLEEAFSECAKAMFSVMVNIEMISPDTSFEFKVKSSNREELLIDFLNELLYLKDINGMMFSGFYLYITRDRGKIILKGKASGEKVNKKKHDLKSEVKAATYHQLKIEKKNGEFVAQCVVDV